MSTLTDQIKAKCATIAQNQQLIYEKGKSEGGGGEPTTPTDNRTCLSYWYQGLVEYYGWKYKYDYDLEETVLVGDILEECEYPKGTQNVTTAKYFATIFTEDDMEAYPFTSGACIKKFTGTLDLSNTDGNLEGLFYGCKNLEDTGTIIFPKKVTKAAYMFANCEKLTTIPNIDTSDCTDFDWMFSNCARMNFDTFTLDTRNGTRFSTMFNYCKFEVAPMMNTSKAISVYSMYYYCKSLKEIPELDLRNATSTTYIVTGCSALTKVRFKNLKVNTQIGSGTSWGHLINVDDLIFMIYHLRNVGASRTLTIGSANLEKLAKVYVKTISITDAMRAEDDLIDEKLPFEVCQSTDEGATKIIDYALYKKWTLK